LPGLATGWIDASLEEGQKLDADIKLAKAVRVPVTVRDREGRPIAGARVGSLGVTGPNPTFWINDSLYDPDRRRGFSVQLPQSDAAGRLTLPPVPLGCLVTFDLYHHDFAPARVWPICGLTRRPSAKR
jgi:hypothetical protein